MKFHNGQWLLKQGVAAFSPKAAYYVHIEPDKVTICAPTDWINNRGDTLGGVSLTVEITAPMPEIIRVRAAHYLGVAAKKPEFDLFLPDEDEIAQLGLEEGSFISAIETEDAVTVQSGSLKLTIDKKHWTMSYERDGDTICESAMGDLAYIKTDWNGLAYDDGGDAGTYMRQQLSLGVGECIYGLGERFTSFVKNGQSVVIRNEDGGTTTQQSYKNVPFYVSNKGYGVFVNHPETVEFEVGTESVEKVSFSVPGQTLDYFFINGPTVKTAVSRYTLLTGRPALPPAWTFGLWLSTSFTTDYDEDTVNSFIDGMSQRDIPVSVFHFDCFWMKEYCWCDFTFDDRVFPDPEGMLAGLHGKGLRVCVWINPYVGQASSLWREGMERGYFIKRTNGDVYQWDMWQSGMAIVDFTNPAAKKWYQAKLAALLDIGVDCFKTDFGERIPVDDVVYFDGSDPEKMHNYYSYIYNQTVFELLEKVRGVGEAVLFARSATAGGQKFPVHWGGDCYGTYNSMAESLRGGLSLTMSGFGYWSHDIGGFESTSTPDVYKRWCAFGLLSSHSRLHGSSSYRVPWVYDEEAVSVLARFVRLKARLMPYIFGLAVENSRSGLPLMRAMVMEFPKDPACAYLDRQYMLGASLLVAPIFNDKGIGEYYLPLPGQIWTHLLTGETREGGRWYKETYDYLSLPLFVRPSSIIPTGEGNLPEYDYADCITLAVYGAEEPGFAADTAVYSAGSTDSAALSVKAERIEDHIFINVQTDKACRIVLVGLRGVTCAQDGVSVDDTNSDTIIVLEQGRNLECRVASRV